MSDDKSAGDVVYSVTCQTCGKPFTFRRRDLNMKVMKSINPPEPTTGGIDCPHPECKAWNYIDLTTTK